jgi:hypothetical protein
VRRSYRRRTWPAPKPRSTSPTCGWAARDQDQGLPVHAAAVVLRQGGAPRVRHPRSRSLPRGPRLCVRTAWRHTTRQDPLRQPEVRRLPSAVRPRPGRVATLDRVPLALRLRRLLLPTRQGRCAREGRRRRRGWPIPPHPLRPDAGRGLHRGTQRPARGRRRQGRAPAQSSASRWRSNWGALPCAAGSTGKRAGRGASVGDGPDVRGGRLRILGRRARCLPGAREAAQPQPLGQ